ncbi:MAG TPA: thioredoxin domain-containing protein, partial [Streptosporangiaceae bacterium]|nr:thioredoxin domain-containing protein [Streptosporangiaceae bacterium]
LIARISRGQIQPPVGWAAVTGAGTIAGVGFIVSLLIASLAFHGTGLAEAKVGVLSAAVASSALTWIIFRVAARLPKRLRLRALLGTAETITDLAVPVSARKDHVRGPADAPVTLVEYGDFECPYCGQAERVVRELLAEYGDDLRYVWRHLPLTDVHPYAPLAAEASEAAAKQGKFWEMHDQLLDHQGALTTKDLMRYAAEIGLNTEQFTADMRKDAGAGKIASDVDSADLSDVSGTPTFFINGKRYHGAFDLDTLSRRVRTARARALI